MFTCFYFFTFMYTYNNSNSKNSQMFPLIICIFMFIILLSIITSNKKIKKNILYYINKMSSYKNAICLS